MIKIRLVLRLVIKGVKNTFHNHGKDNMSRMWEAFYEEEVK